MGRQQLQYCADCDVLEVSDESGICHKCRGHAVSSHLTIVLCRYIPHGSRIDVGDMVQAQRRTKAPYIDGHEMGQSGYKTGGS